MTPEEILEAIKALPLSERIRFGWMLVSVNTLLHLTDMKVTATSAGAWAVGLDSQVAVLKIKKQREKPKPLTLEKMIRVRDVLREWPAIKPKPKGGKWVYAAKKLGLKGGALSLKNSYKKFEKKHPGYLD